jgi:hypothetical protein
MSRPHPDMPAGRQGRGVDDAYSDAEGRQRGDVAGHNAKTAPPGMDGRYGEYSDGWSLPDMDNFACPVCGSIPCICEGS